MNAMAKLLLCKCFTNLVGRGNRPFLRKYKQVTRSYNQNSGSNYHEFQLNFYHEVENFSDVNLNGEKRNSNVKEKKLNFDNLGAWDNQIELELLLDSSIKHGKPIPKISVSHIGHASLLGRRERNEDRFIIKEIEEDLIYCGVFDGHGGPECSQFCCDILEDLIKQSLNKGEVDLQAVFHKSFIELDKKFSSLMASEFKEENGLSCGSTATVCLLRASVELVIGHVGDSRAILCRDSKAKDLTTDHCPSNLFEKTRIEKCGGKILSDSYNQQLVNGKLAMTRSIGDLELKKSGVISVPETRSLEVKHGKDSFLVLTTDGINHVMSNQEVCDTIMRCQDPFEAASVLTDLALQFASQDNATAIVIPFGSWGKQSSTSSIFHGFGRQMASSSRFS